MTTLEYNGATITFKPATARNRLRLTDLRNIVGYWTMPDSDDKSLLDTALTMLYLVESVNGDLGFPVPCNGDATKESLMAFNDGFWESHENLYVTWANKLYEVRTATQSDPDLLPPSELTESQKKVKSSDKSDSTKS